MSKSSTFLISDLISEQKNNSLNTSYNNKQKHNYQHHLFTNYSNDFNSKMNSIFNNNNKKSNELCNSRSSLSSHGGDTPSVSSTSSISSISNSNLGQDDQYNHLNDNIIKNKTFSNFLNNTNNCNVNLETNLIHSTNKYCNCMACNAVRFFSMVNPNFNESIINTNQQEDGITKNINDKINNHVRKIETKQNKINNSRGKYHYFISFMINLI
jgi:hypothetical protein